jgi:hypothetical protein
MRTAGTVKSRTKAAIRARRSGGGKRRPREENLVVEIVDQITRKQSAPGSSRPVRPSTEVCSFCLEPKVSGSPYRLVLKCGTGDPSAADP